MFDDLLLLGPGGRTVYMGSEEGVYAYFENLGFKVPDRGSPPEYLLDVIAGLEAADNPQGPPPSRAESLFQHWEDHSAALQVTTLMMHVFIQVDVQVDASPSSFNVEFRNVVFV